MSHLKRPWMVPLAVFALCLLTGERAAPAEAPERPRHIVSPARDKSLKHWLFHFEQRAYPLGEIAKGARLRALEQIERSKHGVHRSSLPVRGNLWVNVGPAPILGGQIGATGDTRSMSGRVTAIAVDPGNPNHWLAGAAQGGIWETFDAGATWTPKTDAEASLAVGAIAFAPSNRNIIYVGTGEANFADSYLGEGVLKSTDAGATWQLLGSSVFSGISFSAISVDPSNPDIVVAGTSFAGIVGPHGATSNHFAQSGVYKSTDGGLTWAWKPLPNTEGSVQDAGVSDLAVDPRNFRNQYAGFGWPFPGLIFGGVYRSLDTGENWMRIRGPWDSNPASV